MRTITVLLFVGVLAAACGDSGPPDAASMCRDLADEAADRFGSTLAEVDAAMARGESFAMDWVQGELADLSARADDLGCDVADLNARVIDGISDLESSSIEGQLVLAQVRVLGLFEAP